MGVPVVEGLRDAAETLVRRSTWVHAAGIYLHSYWDIDSRLYSAYTILHAAAAENGRIEDVVLGMH